MSLGRMNCLISIIKRTISIDSEGFKTEKESTVLDTRCYHEQRHSSLRWTNLAAFSEATDRFVLRMAPGVTVETGYFLDCHGTRYNCTEFPWNDRHMSKVPLPTQTSAMGCDDCRQHSDIRARKTHNRSFEP